MTLSDCCWNPTNLLTIKSLPRQSRYISSSRQYSLQPSLCKHMAKSFESKSSFSSSGVGYTYDVFLSFRGDTRKNFTDHLYCALVQAGIHTFRDDKDLLRGEEISQGLLEAIQESRISIVVFSKCYASSTWCLDELAKIMECKYNINQIVLPVFYDIDPSDIRKQTGSFAEAFKVLDESLKEEMKANKWRGALKEVLNLSGYPLKNMANGHESTFIQKIVEDVSNKLNRKYLHVARHPVGIDSRVDDMISWLRIEITDVRVVGIHGMPGIGKTTIAKVLFNQLCNRFEGSCFLKCVAEKSKQHSGLVQLQEQLLCQILKQDSLHIDNEDRGINLINERLCHKRVFVVLDNVEHQEQLDALMAEGSLFGLGSVIVITTRNEQLLNRFEVVVKHQVEFLNEDETLELFSWHAFRDTCPPKDYMELSRNIIDYSGGLPLAIEILGCCLFKKDKIRWESVIDRLRKIPNHDIQKKLIVSFDMLDDDKLQNVFLDIACFFIGRKKEYVKKVLEARCGFNPEDDLGILSERSLITVNVLGEINMHDLLRDMGREIIRKMSPDHPGKRNRMWHDEDTWNVLVKQMGTEAVEGLAMDVTASTVGTLSTESFTKMEHLQLLRINGLHLIGCFKGFPKGLIWLSWHECPLKSLPSEFELGNLVILDMQYSNIKELWKETRILNKLKILNLSYCKYLAKTPNFLGLSNLERLILQNCSQLIEVQKSIGHLKRLVFLSLEGCCRLQSLPQSICDVRSLETLNVSGCTQLEKLPEHMSDMESLTELLADGIENEQFLTSVLHLKYVRKLTLCRCSSHQDSQSSSSWGSLISSWLSPRGFNWSLLTKLNLASFGLSDSGLNCVHFGSLSSLIELDLSGNGFVNLPPGIGCLDKLEILRVEDCRNLVSISGIPLNLKYLLVNDCASIESVKFPIQSKKVAPLPVNHCEILTEIQGMQVREDDGNSSYNLLKKSKRRLLQEFCNKDYGYEIHFSGSEIPDWFGSRGEGFSLSFHLPSFFQGLVLWVVYEYGDNMHLLGCELIIKNKSNGIQLFKKFVGGGELRFSHITSCIRYVRSSEFRAMEDYGGEELELYVKLKTKHLKVKECGVHVIVEKSDLIETQDGIGIDRQAEAGGESESECGDDDFSIDEADEAATQEIAVPTASSTDHEQWKKYLVKELPNRNIFIGRVFGPN